MNYVTSVGEAYTRSIHIVLYCHYTVILSLYIYTVTALLYHTLYRVCIETQFSKSLNIGALSYPNRCDGNILS